MPPITLKELQAFVDVEFPGATPFLTVEQRTVTRNSRIGEAIEQGYHPITGALVPIRRYRFDTETGDREVVAIDYDGVLLAPATAEVVTIGVRFGRKMVSFAPYRGDMKGLSPDQLEPMDAMEIVAKLREGFGTLAHEVAQDESDPIKAEAAAERRREASLKRAADAVSVPPPPAVDRSKAAAAINTPEKLSALLARAVKSGHCSREEADARLRDAFPNHVPSTERTTAKIPRPRLKDKEE